MPINIGKTHALESFAAFSGCVSANVLQYGVH